MGDTLYLSGRLGIDPAAGTAPPIVDEELCLLVDGFLTVLAQANMTMDNLVWVQIFSPDLTLWEPFNTANLKRFSKELPARAFIGSGPLLKGGRFEMMGIAFPRQQSFLVRRWSWDKILGRNDSLITCGNGRVTNGELRPTSLSRPQTPAPTTTPA